MCDCQPNTLLGIKRFEWTQNKEYSVFICQQVALRLSLHTKVTWNAMKRTRHSNVELVAMMGMRFPNRLMTSITVVLKHSGLGIIRIWKTPKPSFQVAVVSPVLFNFYHQ